MFYEHKFGAGQFSFDLLYSEKRDLYYVDFNFTSSDKDVVSQMSFRIRTDELESFEDCISGIFSKLISHNSVD